MVLNTVVPVSALLDSLGPKASPRHTNHDVLHEIIKYQYYNAGNQLILMNAL